VTAELGMNLVAAMPPYLCSGFWQLTRSSGVSASARGFVISRRAIRPSCSGLSVATRARVTVMTVGQSNSAPNGMSKLTEAEKRGKWHQGDWWMSSSGTWCRDALVITTDRANVLRPSSLLKDSIT
jgi:hypothetical protein